MAKNSNYKSEDRNPTPPPPLPPLPFGKKGQKTAQTMEEQEADFKKAKTKLIRVGPLALIVIALSFYFVQKPVEPKLMLPQHSFAAFYDAERDLTRFVVDGDVSLANNHVDGALTIIYTPIDGEYAIAADATETYKITPQGIAKGAEAIPTMDYAALLALLSQLDGIASVSEYSIPALAMTDSSPYVPIYGAYCANADGTQLLVQTENCAYILRDGQRPVSIGGKGSNFPIDYVENSEYINGIHVYRGDTLFGLVYRNQNENGHALYGIGEDGTSSRYGAISDYPYQMRSNKTSAYYVKNDTIYLMQNSASEVGTNELAGDIRGDSLCMSASRKLLYFINNNDELRKIKGKGTASLVAQDVAEVWAAMDKGIYFLTNGGELCSYDDRTVRTIATDVVAFEQTYKMLTYYTIDGGVFVAPTGARDGTKFARII